MCFKLKSQSQIKIKLVGLFWKQKALVLIFFFPYMLAQTIITDVCVTSGAVNLLFPSYRVYYVKKKKREKKNRLGLTIFAASEM